MLGNPCHVLMQPRVAGQAGHDNCMLPGSSLAAMIVCMASISNRLRKVPDSTTTHVLQAEQAQPDQIRPSGDHSLAACHALMQPRFADQVSHHDCMSPDHL